MPRAGLPNGLPEAFFCMNVQGRAVGSGFCVRLFCKKYTAALAAVTRPCYDWSAKNGMKRKQMTVFQNKEETYHGSPCN